MTSSENTQPEDATVTQWQFVWSQRYIDAPVCRDENKDGDGDCTSGSDERLYYLTDANMNVTTLTDTAGDAVERYAYDPYGAVTIYDATWSNTRNTSSYGNTVLFAGYWRDSASGLYHVRNRTYHAQLGRWAQRDPVGYVECSSLYTYVGNRPINAIDPSGTFKRSGKTATLYGSLNLDVGLTVEYNVWD